MAKLINRSENELNDSNLSAELGHDMNMLWLIRKMLKEAKFELVNKPKETIKVKRILILIFEFIVSIMFSLF